MRYALLIGCAALALMLPAACEPQARHPGSVADQEAVPADTSVGDEEPLRLQDDDPPLLLEDGPDAASSNGPMADNSRCYVCHLQYQQEELSLDHARAGIRCADCHGESDAHMADESPIWGGEGTPPDIMYTKDEINSACQKCHHRDKIDKAAHQAFFAGNAPQKVCTDCHGNHRLPERKCTWK